MAQRCPWSHPCDRAHSPADGPSLTRSRLTESADRQSLFLLLLGAVCRTGEFGWHSRRKEVCHGTTSEPCRDDHCGIRTGFSVAASFMTAFRRPKSKAGLHRRSFVPARKSLQGWSLPSQNRGVFAMRPFMLPAALLLATTGALLAQDPKAGHAMR